MLAPFFAETGTATEAIRLRTTRSRSRLRLQNLIFREAGQDLVEYALLASLIALAAISGVRQVATSVTGVFSSVSTSLGPQHYEDGH